MQEITLPKRFKEKLDSSNKKFNAIVTEILKNFEDVLNVSKLEFFPEYNDHGIIHLNNILKMQDELIPDKSFLLLTAEDITTLIVATISHDIGMHLNYEGFCTLISSDKWSEKWMEFFQSSKKYNESKLQELFGDTEPIVELPKSKQDFKNRDYMLIGEFLRINHPELAEEILKKGFPSANNKYEILSNQLTKEHKVLEFSALLAKSHGMNLRDTFDEIEKIGDKGDFLTPYNTHIVYIMVILRLSDYLDMYENRNKKVILGLKNFLSDISKFEWEKNTSVTQIKDHWKDKEAIYIGVEPEDSISFINLKNLFRSIQHELDISWAVLGEIYSKEEDLKDFGIKYRRVLSNIDNERSFSKKVNYIPKKIAFNADQGLLKLLIAPLYGNNPTFGVRELLQNAVDACKEYRELTNEHYKPKIHVDIYKEQDTCYFKITDNGIGMTEDTIINYFLKAGASFRNSDFWTKNLKDENNKSKVVRTGRFGVGLLAAFLFGSKIEVQTKSYISDVGYKFSTHLLDNQINIEKDKTCPIGTSIKIEMDQKIFDKLMIQKNEGYSYRDDSVNWKKWYFLNDLDIYYNDHLIEKTLNESTYIELEQEEFTSVKWSYEQGKQICICNGFKIPHFNIELDSSLDLPSSGKQRSYFYFNNNNFNSPSLIITDKEGKLPLSLSRERFLTETFSFNDVLIQSMSDDLFKIFINSRVRKDSLLNTSCLNHPMFFSTNIDSCQIHTEDLYKKFVFNQEGFNVLNSFTLENNGLTNLVFIEFISNENLDKCNKLIEKLIDQGITVLCNHSHMVSNSAGYNYLFRILESGILSIDKMFQIKAATIIMPTEKHQSVMNYKTSYLNIGFKNMIMTATDSMKKRKEPIPASLTSKYYSMSYFKNKQSSALKLEDLDQYENEIGLIVEMNIDSTAFQELDVEYYFYNLMSKYFQDKKMYWLPYCE